MANIEIKNIKYKVEDLFANRQDFINELKEELERVSGGKNLIYFSNSDHTNSNITLKRGVVKAEYIFPGVYIEHMP